MAYRTALPPRAREISLQARNAVAATQRSLSGAPVSLPDLFAGRRQLIVYHYMFDLARDAGCSSCSVVTDNIGHLAHLHSRDTMLVLVSRAPAEKIAAFKRRMSWEVP